jgi:hypothetical protein
MIALQMVFYEEHGLSVKNQHDNLLMPPIFGFAPFRVVLENDGSCSIIIIEYRDAMHILGMDHIIHVIILFP